MQSVWIDDSAVKLLMMREQPPIEKQARMIIRSSCLLGVNE